MNPAEAEALKIVREALITGEARLYDHVSATFRWVMATLFAANGGAIIGLLGWTGGREHGAYSALGWFAAGLVLSILMGILTTIGALSAIKPMVKSKALIEQSLLTGVLPDAKLFEGMVASNRPTWKTLVPYCPGVASFLCLIAGMIQVACHL